MALYEHALVIGGTGMLAGATRVLAGRAEVLTAVARTTQSLRALADNVADTGCILHEIALDWSDPDAFVSGLNQHIERTGPPLVVLAWLHDDRLASRVAQCVTASGSACAFFHVRGSAAAAPSADVLSHDPPLPQNVTYHEIVLGFRVEGSQSRWLTHDEISSGVLTAIADPSPRTIVGTVTPWDRRP